MTTASIVCTEYQMVAPRSQGGLIAGAALYHYIPMK